MATVKITEQQQEWMIKGGAGLATLIFCYVVIIQPVFMDIATLRQGIVDSRKRIELFREVKGFQGELAGFEKNLATVTDRSLMLGKISDIAGRAKLEFDSLTPRTEPGGDYMRLKIEADGKGTFFSLLKFLETVEKLDMAIKVRDVSILKKISQKNPKNRYFLQIHLVFETFLKARGNKING